MNSYTGKVPDVLGKLGCIVNLAGNNGLFVFLLDDIELIQVLNGSPGLEHGPDVPTAERQALIDLYNATSGHQWNTKTNWVSSASNQNPGLLTLQSSSLWSSTLGSAAVASSSSTNLQPVSMWYKIGVLSSHVHSIVMSSNGMDGKIPASIGKLSQLRMIELATMSNLTGPIPKELCQITTLRRLCICRCGLTG